ncbi:MAG: hypothetical protein JXI33_09140, partial [Candidatus Aminicenantes bacterium]|nr:hypothetical protein [Candidatus Aminicenantes bacterium]
MKFKATLLISLGMHLSLAALFIIQPAPKAGSMTYYVDLINLGSGGGRGNGRGGGAGGNKANPASASGTPEAAYIEDKTSSVKNLTVEKKFQSSLRYPDRESRKKTEPEKMISIVRKDRPTVKGEITTQRHTIENGLKTGISSGSGSG